MRRLFLAAIGFLAITTTAVSQNLVNAGDIIERINKGENIEYKNARISGDLDLTHLSNQKVKVEGDNKYPDSVFISMVTVALRFTDCVFEGKVLGYFNPDSGKENMEVRGSRIYNTNFDRDVVFRNCTFNKEVNFKYSEFNAGTSFSGSIFREEAFFKYTVFSKAPDFSAGKFETASFKYVQFPASTSFEGSSFSRETDFKYAQFGDGVNFRKVRFDGHTDFKYAQLKNPELQNAVFKSSADFKYTTVNNRKASLTDLTGN